MLKRIVFGKTNNNAFDKCYLLIKQIQKLNKFRNVISESEDKFQSNNKILFHCKSSRCFKKS